MANVTDGNGKHFTFCRKTRPETKNRVSTLTFNREHRLAQRRLRHQHSDHKHVQRQRQSTTITLQMEPMKRENSTDCRRLKKLWGDQATLTVYSKTRTLLVASRLLGD